MSEIQDKFQEVIAAVEAEKTEILGKIQELSERITELEEQINNGDPITLAQLDALKAQVNDIYTAPTS